MAFSPPEYCRLFAQKKAYQGGEGGAPGAPPGFAPVFIDKCLNAWTSKAVAHSNWRQKRRGNDARMPFSLIYFFAPISIFYIPHNYVILQAMPHAIPQTHSAFYPHVFDLFSSDTIN